MSQRKREYITGLLDKHGIPEAGTVHVIRKGDEANARNEPLYNTFFPDSAVLVLLPESGLWMDGQCYDKQGYKVYAD